ncbi:MAG: hypothetical protein LBT01_01015 [Spirochaetaceae bacterium]|nr:hypothetical protein [Spirochaetaceae bacterium]
MNEFKIGLFPDGIVGLKITDYIIKNHIDDLGFICITDYDSPIMQHCIDMRFNTEKIFIWDSIKNKIVGNAFFDYFISAWWPYIINSSIFSIPRYGTINFHPSYLPFNRGKHPTFWNIIEEVPYGVTLHFIDDGIDTGDILFQKEIAKDWSDTGGTLYEKALEAIVQLFIENYDNIKYGHYERRNQPEGGSFHYAKELKSQLEIDLEKNLSVRELFNLLRAKDFPKSPQCYFYENGKRYEVKIGITPPPS